MLGAGMRPFLGGDGDLSFVYDPTRTDAGAAFFTGFWLPDECYSSSGVPGEPPLEQGARGLGSE